MLILKFLVQSFQNAVLLGDVKKMPGAKSGHKLG